MIDHGATIKKLLQKRDMSASELARRSGITKGSISLYVNNKSVPRESTIATICNALDVSEHEYMDMLYSLAQDDNADNADRTMPISYLSVASRFSRAAKTIIFGKPDVSDELLEKVLDYAAGLVGGGAK